MQNAGKLVKYNEEHQGLLNIKTHLINIIGLKEIYSILSLSYLNEEQCKINWNKIYFARIKRRADSGGGIKSCFISFLDWCSFFGSFLEFSWFMGLYFVYMHVAL